MTIAPTPKSDASSAKWEAESFRFTAFPITPLPLAKIYQTVVGRPPDKIMEMTAQKALLEGGSESPGVHLQIANAGRRLDILLIVPPMIAAAQPIVRVGPYAEWAARLRPYVIAWLKNAPPLARLAFSPAVNIEARDAQDAMAKLADHLPNIDLKLGIADPKSMRDVLWQVNRPRRSAAGDGIEINRMTRWTVGSVTMVEAMAGAPHAMAPPAHFVRLEADINTSPEFRGPIDAERAIQLYEEMEALASEILEKGDVP